MTNSHQTYRPSSTGRLSAVMLVGLVLALSACSFGSNRKIERFVPTVAAEPQIPTPATTAGTNLSGLGPTQQQNVTADSDLDTRALRSKVEKDERSVFFDYDSSTVKTDYDQLVQAVVAEINRSRISALRVEGNTDARGSREYNLALGQRRANAVKSSLTALGVPTASIATISYGKERLLAPGDDEESHAINRRADILYQGEY